MSGSISKLHAILRADHFLCLLLHHYITFPKCILAFRKCKSNTGLQGNLDMSYIKGRMSKFRRSNVIGFVFNFTITLHMKLFYSSYTLFICLLKIVFIGFVPHSTIPQEPVIGPG